MALNADTTGKFDYAAYMSLKNDMYSDVDRITRTRESLVPGAPHGGGSGHTTTVTGARGAGGGR